MTHTSVHYSESFADSSYTNTIEALLLVTCRPLQVYISRYSSPVLRFSIVSYNQEGSSEFTSGLENSLRASIHHRLQAFLIPFLLPIIPANRQHSRMPPRVLFSRPCETLPADRQHALPTINALQRETEPFCRIDRRQVLRMRLPLYTTHVQIFETETKQQAVHVGVDMRAVVTFCHSHVAMLDV